MIKNTFILLLTSLFVLKNTVSNKNTIQTNIKAKVSFNDTLSPPFATKSSRNFSKVIGWRHGRTPVAPKGFLVTKFADSLDNPRWIYVGSNGDIFVSEANTTLKGIVRFGASISRKIKTQHYGKSANRITMFRDSDKDGVYESRYVFAQGLNQPFGMLILNNHFFVANTDALLQFDYKTGDTLLKGEGKPIVVLPGEGYNNHWTRNVIADKNGDKIYISVGSGSNAAEHGIEEETGRANIIEVNPDGSNKRIFASGLRNPVGMDWAPGTNILYTVVNERDNLGDNLVPDYFTSVKENGFYGWPYSYFGKNLDPRIKEQRPDLVNKAIIPDVTLGAHTASLGLVFYTQQSFPIKFHNGAFIAQHGSWNRSTLAGYKVIFIPFSNGKPSGKSEDFLTGFIADSAKSKVYGRPVCVAVLADGSLLVTDDASNTIWKVSTDH